MSLDAENLQLLLDQQEEADDEVRDVMTALETTGVVHNVARVSTVQQSGTESFRVPLIRVPSSTVQTTSIGLPASPMQQPMTLIQQRRHLIPIQVAKKIPPTTTSVQQEPMSVQPATSIAQQQEESTSLVQPVKTSVQPTSQLISDLLSTSPEPMSTASETLSKSGSEPVASTSAAVESGGAGDQAQPVRSSQRLLRNPVPKDKFGSVKQVPDYRQDEEFCTKVQVELFCCNFCQVCFETIDEIKQHLQDQPEHRAPTKPKEKPFPCKQCGKSYVSAMTLSNHVKKMHKKPRKPRPRKTKEEKEAEEKAKKGEEGEELEDGNNEAVPLEDVDDSAEDEDYVAQGSKKKSSRRLFKCVECGNTYPTVLKLRTHMNTHTGDAEFECEKCHDLFKSQAILKQHAKKVHGVEKKTSGRGVPSLECDMCEYVATDRNDFRKHLDVHSGQELKCRICGRGAVDFRRLRKHFRQQHRPGKKWRVCEICGHKSSGPSSLELHMATHTGSRKFKCETCGLRFVRKYAMDRHNEVKHMQIRRYMCNSCGQKFGTNFALQKHEEYHAEEHEKKFRCGTCNEGFIRQNVLKWHIQYYHGTTPKQVIGKRLPFDRNRGPVPGLDNNRRDLPFPCALCKRMFSSHAVRERHVRAFHSTDTSLLCKVCGVRFGAQSKFDQHVASHNGMSSHKCRFCPKTFKRDHLRQVHESEKHTGARPWKCTCCDERFISKARMYAHRLIHYGREIRCELCNRNFASLALKRRHMRKHTEIKEYRCEICQKEYKQKSNFTAHMKIHTGERSMKCDHCDEMFMDLTALRKHLICHQRPEQQTLELQQQQEHEQHQLHLHSHEHILQVLQQEHLQPLTQQIQIQHQAQPLGQQHQHHTVQIIPQQHLPQSVQPVQHLQIIQTDPHHEQQHGSEHHHQILEQQHHQIIRPLIQQQQGATTHHHIQQITGLQQTGESIDLVAYNCDVCGQMFLSTEALINHCQTHVMEAHQQHGDQRGEEQPGGQQVRQLPLFEVVSDNTVTTTNPYF